MGYLLFIHFYRFLILTSYYLDITGPIMVAVEKVILFLSITRFLQNLFLTNKDRI